MRRINWTTIALIGGLVLLVLIVAYFATRRNADQDKLTGSADVIAGRAERAQQTASEKFCGTQSIYDLIKRDLFRRAAQLRGSDQVAYDKVASFSVLRMENPVLVSETKDGLIRCSGSLSLDLPPGVAVVGGRRTLSADLDYNVVPQAADGTGPVVLLSNADAIITPLATLSRTAQAAPQVVTPEANVVAPEAPQGVQAAPQPQPPVQAPAPAPAPASRPSFACASARTRGESMVCADSGLAAADRSMAVEYSRAFAVASPDQRDLLRETAHRFYAYRDRCPDRACIAAAYAGRVREIRDIVQGRWQQPR
ncbi:MAG: lysozyme inhibitor LprI family protein [Sphingomonas sp.]